jgi:hypothetical protein
MSEITANDNSNGEDSTDLDTMIQDFETRLNNMYEIRETDNKNSSDSSSGSSNTSQQVFQVKENPVESQIPETIDISSQKSNGNFLQYLYLVIPLSIASILYYFKPKRIMRGSKIDKYKYTKLLFIITFVSWGLLFLALNFSGK